MIGITGTGGQTKNGAGYMVYRDIAYVAGGGPLQSMDVYIPDGAAPEGGWPAVAYAHGGGFVAGDKANEGQSLRFPLQAIDHGVAMISLNYRLPGREPEHIAMELADVQAALRYLKEHAEELGINKDKIASMGASAGGALVCAAATRAKKEGEAGVAAVVSIASATDITGAADDVDGDTPPFFIIHGTADSIVGIGQAEKLAAALKAAAVPYVFQAVEGGEHTRPVDHPNTLTLLEEQNKLEEAILWLKGILASIH